MPRAARWGSIEKLKSGNLRARYRHPETGKQVKAPTTFAKRRDAEAWLAIERSLIETGQWIHPNERQEAEAASKVEAQRKAVTFGDYAENWVETRTNRQGQPLASRTREEYLRYLDDRLADFKEMPIRKITSDTVSRWYSQQVKDGKMTSVGRQYDFFKSVLKSAVEDELIASNPCKVRGGSKASTEIEVKAPTEQELQIIIDSMPESLKHVVLLAASAGLRWGEIAALTPEDFDIEVDERGVVNAVRVTVDKAEVRLRDGVKEVKAPKSKAGVRVVSFYGTDARDVAERVKQTKAGETITEHTYAGLTYHWRNARKAAGRPDLHFHSLRHYQGTRFAQQGATLAEIMARLGHSDVKSAMHYQEAAASRMDELARRAAR